MVLNHSTDVTLQASKSNFQDFLGRLERCAKGELFPFTLTLHDPLGKQLVSQSLCV